MGKLTDDKSPKRELRPGDVFTWSAGGKDFTLHRTERDYVFDLCDAYNAARPQDVIDRGVEWYVAPNGELRIGTTDEWTRKNLKRAESRLETERARHNRLQLEAERARNAFVDEPA